MNTTTPRMIVDITMNKQVNNLNSYVLSKTLNPSGSGAVALVVVD